MMMFVLILPHHSKEVCRKNPCPSGSSQSSTYFMEHRCPDSDCIRWWRRWSVNSTPTWLGRWVGRVGR